jgi:AAA domain, putative AbiEii toxin, Type IV TA system
MTAEPLEPAATGDDDRPRFLSVELDDWPGLGGAVHLDLDPRRTLLIGKNGAGKSLIVDGLYRAAQQACVGLTYEPAGPGQFRCDVSVGGMRFAYESRIQRSEPDEEEDVALSERPAQERTASWFERCWRLDDGAEVWRVDEATFTVPSRDKMTFFPDAGLLSVVKASEPSTPLEELRDLLRGVRIVSAGIPRRDISGRKEILVRGVRRPKGRRWVPQMRSDRAQALAATLVSNWEQRRELSDEVIALLQQLGLVKDVAIKVYEDPGTEPEEERVDYAAVLFDGTNLGLLSDGTLRVTEIVVDLLRPGVSCLLVEEPETAVHPGLLNRLLSLMESYSFDRQIVLSTHAPHIVDRFSPSQVRLVEREGGATSIRSLDKDECARVTRYLEDEGTFSDYLFGRGEE